MKQQKEQEWWAASRSLGLALMDDTLGNEPASHFDTMVSSLAPHTRLSEHNWMIGRVEGHEVLITYYFRDGGSSSDTLLTHVMARIDPSLFLGIEIERRSFLSGVPKIGVPDFDEKLTIQAFQPERGAAMVWPGRTPALDELVLRAAAVKYAPRICDSYVRFTVDRFESNPRVLTIMLRDAIHLANAFAERRAQLGETQEEAAVRGAWSHFAETERMQHDPARRTLQGRYRGIETAVVTRTAPRQAWLGVRVALPIAPGIDLTMTHETGLTRFANMIGFSDITVGDAAFDHQFRLKGGPAQLVRHFFARDETRAAAAKLVQRFGTLRISGATTAVMAPPASQADVLASILDDLVAFVHAQSGGRMPGTGPYRA
jgi:hypothetical protein